MQRKLLLLLLSAFLLCLASIALAAPAHKAAGDGTPPPVVGRVPLDRTPSPVKTAPPASKQAPAAYTVTMLDGLWKADIARTKEMFGAEAAEQFGADADVVLEFDTAGKMYRVWKDVAKSEKLLEIPLTKVTISGSSATLHEAKKGSFSLEFVDADTLVMVGRDAVLGRIKPGAGK